MADLLARDRARLLELLRQLSFERRKIKLSSGAESDFYIDCRKTALTAEGHFLIGRLLLDAIREKCAEVEGVGGMTLGADPLASAVSLTSYLAGRPLAAFLVRKEPKAHGTGQSIEGRTNLSAAARVAIVEDAVTTGGSALRAVERAQEEGLVVAHVFALVDRLEGGAEKLAARGFPLTSLFTRKDFMS